MLCNGIIIIIWSRIILLCWVCLKICRMFTICPAAAINGHYNFPFIFILTIMPSPKPLSFAINWMEVRWNGCYHLYWELLFFNHYPPGIPSFINGIFCSSEFTSLCFQVPKIPYSLQHKVIMITIRLFEVVLIFSFLFLVPRYDHFV